MHNLRFKYKICQVKPRTKHWRNPKEWTRSCRANKNGAPAALFEDHLKALRCNLIVAHVVCRKPSKRKFNREYLYGFQWSAMESIFRFSMEFLNFLTRYKLNSNIR